jgi:2-dehydro-3-deoxy-D-arabinonate dehydratase
LANDVSAWDIERENALYLPQSKIFDRCCALGPYLLTPDEVADPYELTMTCTITRGSDETFAGSCSTNKLRRKFEELIACLVCCNSIPAPTVLLTGTGIIVTEEAALRPGDVTSIGIAGFGVLSNPAALV